MTLLHWIMDWRGLLQWDGSLGRGSGVTPTAKTILTTALGEHEYV